MPVNKKKISEEAAGSIVEWVDQLIREAVEKNASDVHLEPTFQDVKIRFRIDGLLREMGTQPIQLYPTIVSRIKVMASMDITETRKPQEGYFDFEILREDQPWRLNIRVSIFPTTCGEAVVLRLHNREEIYLEIDNLGLDAEEKEQLLSIISKPQGLILITGPNGSGKTTSLYSILNYLKKTTKSILTLEDPVEYYLVGTRQTQINPAIGLTFSEGLKYILRQDPDIIMIGEIRDKETVDIAARAALTGILIFSTIHTRNAPATIMRLVNLGLDELLIASALVGVVAQRLVRKICPECMEEYIPPSDLLKMAGPAVMKIKKFRRGRGCENCGGTGYKGRRAIFEIMPVDREIQSLIINKATPEEIAEVAKRKGMHTLEEKAVEKVVNGETTLEEMLRVIL